jgi:gamma-glutamylcysteine synthetase
MKFITLSNSNPERLATLVNDYLREGWKLHGDLVQFNHNLIQAMTQGEYIRPARLKQKQASETDGDA